MISESARILRGICIIAVLFALSMYTVAGCVSGLVFGTTYKIMKRFTVAFGFLLCAIGAALVWAGPNFILMTLGLMCIGFGFSVLMPAGFGILGMRTPPTTIAVGTSVAMALMNLGGFISTYWLVLVDNVMCRYIQSLSRCNPA